MKKSAKRAKARTPKRKKAKKGTATKRSSVQTVNFPRKSIANLNKAVDCMNRLVSDLDKARNYLNEASRLYHKLV